jgi:hypothetical protein
MNKFFGLLSAALISSALVVPASAQSVLSSPAYHDVILDGVGSVVAALQAGSSAAPVSAAARTPTVNDDALENYSAVGSANLFVSAGGSGYATGDTVTLSAPTAAGGVQATASLVITGGVITGTVLTNPGSGYSSAVNNGIVVTIHTSTGTGATILAGVDQLPSLWNTGKNWYQAASVIPGEARWSILPNKQALPCDINSCFAAYGTRLLTNTYTAGSALDVINPVGGATVTLSFDADGVVDVRQVQALCGATGCRVVKVYDQGTCGTSCDATQPTAAGQPIIQALALDGNAPAIVFDDGLMNAAADGHKSSLILPSAVTFTANASGGLVVGRVNNALNTAGTSLFVSFTGTTPLDWGYLTGGGMGLQFGGAYASNIGPLMTAEVGGWATASQYNYSFYGDSASLASGKGAVTETGGTIGGTTDFYADFSAIMIWNTTQTIAAMNQYYIAAAQLFDLAPQGKSVIVGDGDSITFGQAATAGVNYTRQLEPLLSQPAIVVNSGSPGQTLNAGLTQFYVGKYYSNKDPVVIDNLWYGTNDLNNNPTTTTAASLFAQEMTYCAQVHALGPNAKIVGITMMPRNTNTTAEETVRLAFNALMVANAGSCTFDAIADVGDDPTLGNQALQAAFTLTTGVHPYTPGYAYVAQIVAAADNTLLASGKQ